MTRHAIPEGSFVQSDGAYWTSHDFKVSTLREDETDFITISQYGTEITFDNIEINALILLLNAARNYNGQGRRE
jgi:hypothetical protein